MTEYSRPDSSYRETKRLPEAREYRDALADSLRSARAYDGSEAQYRALMASLEHLEEVIRTSPSLQESGTNQEVEAALLFAPVRPRDINEVLSLALASRDQHLRNAFERKEGAYLFHKIDRVILPPGDALEKDGTGEGGFTAREFEERVGKFLSFLEKNGIFADDVVITVGAVPQNAFRKVSYTHIEIPRLDRVVFLCDQIGEATFIIKGYIDPNIPLKKEDLLSKLPQECKRVVKRTDEQWFGELHEYLFVEKAWDDFSQKNLEQRKKIDVRDLDAWRSAVQTEVTLEEFLASSVEGNRRRKYHGVGLEKLFSIFKQSGVDYQRLPQLEFAQKIWGVGHPEIDYQIQVYRRSPEDWRGLIRARFTPESWLAMSRREMRSLKIDDFGYEAIMKAAGISLSDRLTVQDHIRVARVIWNNPDFRGPHEDREYTYPPEGWKTVHALASDLKRSVGAVKARLPALRLSNPADFADFRHPDTENVREFLSPKVIALVEEGFAGVGSRRESWRDVSGDLEVAEAKPGWKTVHEIFTAYKATLPPAEAEKITDGIIRKIAVEVMEEMPDHVEISRDEETGRPRKRLSPIAIQEILLRVEQTPPLAPEGWFTGPMLLRKHAKNARIVARIFAELCAERPNASQVLLDAGRRRSDFFPPDFVDEFERRIRLATAV